MIRPFLPMLAVASEPFDSSDYLFEVKWDGVRALACVQGNRWRVWGRKLADYTDRYPELDALRGLPSGTVLDGELVVLRDGKTDLSAILRRHQLASARKIQQASRHLPATYVLFDCLYHQGRSLADQPLDARRAVLAELHSDMGGLPVAFSDGLIGCGRTFFEKVVQQGHEGVMGKHLQSRYLPGRRDSAWRKIKPWQVTACVIIAYTRSRAGFSSLLVAEAEGRTLRYVGQLTSGFTNEMRTRLMPRLIESRCAQAVVPCSKRAVWVTPRLYCEVRFLSRTAKGRLRGAHFVRLIDADA
jgi:DNA ligase D-like protein (predicted ligase)